MKKLVLALSLALMAPAPVMAVDSMGLPWKAVSRQEDRKRVLEFFMFTCRFCMQSDEMFMEWGRTLPRSMTFEQVPVITNKNDFNVAMAYYAVKQSEPQRLEAFKQALFRRAALAGISGNSTDSVLDALRESGASRARFLEAVASPTVREATERAARLSAEYQIEMTPTVVVAGKYLFHAGYTGGNYEMLIQLGNGLVSREIGGGR